MHQASVGFHCPECTKSGAQKVVRAGQLRQRPAVTYVLIAINLVIFFACVGSGLQTRQTVVVDYGLLGQGFRDVQLRCDRMRRPALERPRAKQSQAPRQTGGELRRSWRVRRAHVVATDAGRA